MQAARSASKNTAKRRIAGQHSRGKPGLRERQPQGTRHRSCPAQVCGYAEQSLRNLGVDAIDLYYPDLGLTPAQLALAWLLHQDDHVVPIPGSRTSAHITETSTPPESYFTRTR